MEVEDKGMSLEVTKNNNPIFKKLGLQQSSVFHSSSNTFATKLHITHQ